MVRTNLEPGVVIRTFYDFAHDAVQEFMAKKIPYRIKKKIIKKSRFKLKLKYYNFRTREMGRLGRREIRQTRPERRRRGTRRTGTRRT